MIFAASASTPAASAIAVRGIVNMAALGGRSVGDGTRTIVAGGAAGRGIFSHQMQPKPTIQPRGIACVGVPLVNASRRSKT